MQASIPSIAVEVIIFGSLKPGDALTRSMIQLITGEMTGLFRTLGIPGVATINVSIGSGPDLVEVRVDGKPCLYPDALLQRVYCYVRGLPLAPAQPSEIKAWIEDGESLEEKRLADFVCRLSIEAIKQQPQILFGMAQAAAYQALLAAASTTNESWPPAPDALIAVLRRVLRLKLSIAEHQKVAEVLAEGLRTERSLDEIVEDLVAALRPDVIEIRVPEDYLRLITISDADVVHQEFTTMRDELFYELGLRYPDFRFVSDDRSGINGFGFSINHLETFPWIGFTPGRCLVNETMQRLRLLGLEAEPAVSPVSGKEWSFIDESNRPTAAGLGLTVWTPMGYLMLCLSVELRTHARCFVDHTNVETEISLIEETFPSLTAAVRSKYSIETLAGVLRDLVSEETSVRNLRLILEALLDFDFIVADGLNHIIFDDRFPVHKDPDSQWLANARTLTQYVRSRMKRYLSHKYTRGQSTLVVYLVDPEIERSLLALDPDSISDDIRIRVLEAVRKNLSELPPSASSPAILTTIEVRAALREIIAPVLPKLPVLAYQELAPEMNIQPIARISLP